MTKRIGFARITEKDVVIYEYRRTSEEKQRLAYREEQRWIAAIENGTIEDTDKSLSPENLDKLKQVGTLAEHDSLKQMEYMVVTSICLASRAAIRGGMNNYEAYTLSDLYYQRASRCTDVMELLNLYMRMADDFGHQVKLARQNRKTDCVEPADITKRHREEAKALEEEIDICKIRNGGENR